MNYRTFDLEPFEFLDERGWLTRLLFSIANKSSSISGTTSINPPVIYKNDIFGWSPMWHPTIDVLGGAIGFDDPASLEILASHRWRLRFWYIHVTILNLLFLLFIASILSYGFLLVLDIAKDWGVYSDWIRFYRTNPLANWLDPTTIGSLQTGVDSVVWVALIISYFSLFFIALFVMKLISILADKYYADTLCIVAIIYLVIELSRDDILKHSGRKRALLARINDLARNTLLLPLCFAGNAETNKTWLKEHFRHMERYIRERERWIIAPTETTLARLRRDFYHLTAIYVTGDYGKFTWPTVVPAPEKPPRTLTQRLVAGLPRFVGVVLPLVVMVFFLWQGTVLESIGLEPRFVAIIFIAWLLLSIDLALDLGIVPNVVSLAREIKDLT